MPCGERLPRPRTGPARQEGAAWILVLMTLAVVSAAGAVVAQRWSDQISRHKERELLRVGNLYAQALARYRAVSPGADPRYPQALEDLLLDTRFVGVQRHLRRLYPDPVTGAPDWILLRDARGDIIGLRSRSAQRPWARVPQRLSHVDLPAADRHTDWLFTPRTSP